MHTSNEDYRYYQTKKEFKVGCRKGKDPHLGHADSEEKSMTWFKELCTDPGFTSYKLLLVLQVTRAMQRRDRGSSVAISRYSHCFFHYRVHWPARTYKTDDVLTVWNMMINEGQDKGPSRDMLLRLGPPTAGNALSA